MNFRGILIAKEGIRYNLFIMVLPTLDAHSHFDPSCSSLELSEAGALLAMTLSLVEAAKVIERQEPLIAWGVGCHPRKLAAQQAFDPDRFAGLAGKSAIIGEVGLDTVYQVPMERQLTTLRLVLAYTAKNPRIISLHSFNYKESVNPWFLL